MEIRHKNVEDLTPLEYKACLAANYGPEWSDNGGGYMYGELQECRSKDSDNTGRVIMLWDGPDDSVKSLLAWCLMTPVRSWGNLWASEWNRKKAKYTCQFWVKRNHRKKGLGRILMDEVIKIDPCPHVFPHNTAAAAFFVDYKVTASGSERRRLHSAKRRKKSMVA